MPEANTPKRTELEAERDKLRQTLANLAELAEQGLPVAEARAKVEQQLADIETRLRGLPIEAARFDQQRQRVEQQLNIGNLYQLYQAASGRAGLSEAEFQAVLADYLSWVRREYGYTRLHGLQTLQDTGPLARPLAQVYTSLAVRHRPAVLPGGEVDPAGKWGETERLEGAAEPEPVDMAELLSLGERVAIVGGAGSGKTTYLSFMAASLAAALQGEALDIRLKPPAGDAPLPVPLLAPLRFWQVYREACAQVPGLPVTHSPDAGSLGAFLLWFLQARYKNFDLAGDFFERLLRGGQGCLILLDGLDEVVSLAERRTVRDEVGRLLTSQYPHNRCLVTARQAGYRDAPFGSDFVRCDVQPMNQSQIETLVGAWCEQIYLQPRDRATVRSDLARAIADLNEERVTRGQAPLVTTPLLVTMVVSVKYSRRELPRERAKLYDACVDVVLSGEYSGGEDATGARRGLVYAGGPPDKQREWLSLLAFRMQQGGRAGASLSEQELRTGLDPIFAERGELSLLDNFIAASRQRGGLFEARGDRFQFMHLTFQEYLAAQFLAQEWPHQPPEFLAGLVTDEWWREALLLTIGSLGPPAPYMQRRAFIEALCGLPDSTMPAMLAGAELAAIGLGDLTEPEPRLGNLVRERLVALLADPALKDVAPPLRAAAGNALAQLGDPRDFDALVTIPAGPFLMGSSQDDGQARENETPQHTLTLPEFQIGRYPVTNGQYWRFIEVGGYGEKRWWTGAGWQMRNEKNWTEPRFWQDARFNRLNQPLVGVSWYEAAAYCRWLSAETGRTHRLPTEAEWEKAARGPDRRIYPWGNAWRETSCNNSELNLGAPVAVGLFPEGASPDGCLDMAGNVWEWCASKFGKPYPYNVRENEWEQSYLEGTDRRVLRGGSWYNSRYNARCAVRDGDYPHGRRDDFGFRIVVSPISPSAL